MEKKKRVILKIVMIGTLHSFLYLWLIPYVIFPRFGHNGILMAMITAVMISVAVLGSIFIGRKSDSSDFVKKDPEN